MDRFTLQEFSSISLRSYFRYRKKCTDGKSLWFHRDTKGEIISKSQINPSVNYDTPFQHINDLSLRIELPWTLSKAEGIYHQLMSVANFLPDHIRVTIGLEPLHKPEVSDSEEEVAATAEPQTNGSSSRPGPRSSAGSGNVVFGNNEVSFERGLNLSYM